MRTGLQPRRQSRRMVENAGFQSVVLLEPIRHRSGDRIQMPALAEHLGIETHDRVAQTDIRFAVPEIAVHSPAEFVRGPMLMEQPCDLVWMADEVRRELRGDDQIDFATVAFAQIEQPPRGRVREEFFLWIPLE